MLRKSDFNKFKTKIIFKVGKKVFLDGKKDMEKIQKEVAWELRKKTHKDLKICEDVVHFVISEFIDKHKGGIKND